MSAGVDLGDLGLLQQVSDDGDMQALPVDLTNSVDGVRVAADDGPSQISLVKDLTNTLNPSVQYQDLGPAYPLLGASDTTGLNSTLAFPGEVPAANYRMLGFDTVALTTVEWTSYTTLAQPPTQNPVTNINATLLGPAVAIANPTFLQAIPAGPLQALRADLGITTTPGFITSWADQSGNSINESGTPGTVPYIASDAGFNGHPTIGGASVFVHLDSAASLGLGPHTGWTFAWVISFSAQNDYGGSWQGATGGTMGAVLNYLDSSNNPGVQIVNGVNNEFFVPGPAEAGVAFVIVFTWDTSGNAAMYQNGVLVQSGASFLAAYTTLNFTQTGGNHSKWAEKVVWARILTSTEITKYSTYAIGRYALP